MVCLVPGLHPLLDAHVRYSIERAATEYLGRTWTCTSFTNLNDQASHPAGILHGRQLSVFAKLGAGVDVVEQFTSELAGLDFVRQHAALATPTPVGSGVLALENRCLLLFEALRERLPAARTRADWRAIGRTLAILHQVHADAFGISGVGGFFGPLRQDNRPTTSNRWAEFYAERRVRPRLRAAVDAGSVPMNVAVDVERLLERLPALGGPEPRPSLLHGDAQQHNFVSTDAGAVVIDAAPYFGHPELDLALVDYFDPVPDDVFNAYQEIVPIDPGFAERRELWRIFAYLAVVTVEGHEPFGRRILSRLAEALRTHLAAEP
jgi:fructosamine-3-kinase